MNNNKNEAIIYRLMDPMILGCRHSIRLMGVDCEFDVDDVIIATHTTS